MINCKNYYPFNDQDGIYTEKLARFINRIYFHYESAIHEQIRPLKKSQFKRILIPITIDHNGYNCSPMQLKIKQQRNLTVLFKILDKKSNDPYLYFQIGQSYNISHDDKNAAYYYGKGLEFDLNLAYEYVQLMVIGYGYALLNLNRYEDALVFENIYNNFSTSADFTTLMGLIYLRCGYPQKAFIEFKKSTTFKECKVKGANSFISNYNIACVYVVLGKINFAIKFYKKCGNCRSALERLKKIEPTMD